jgi:hypothetical protein
MTLCILWRDESSNIQFFSDSRVTMGAGVSSDFGIKIVRIPYNIYGPSYPIGVAPLLASGDLGMAFAGYSVLPLMVKEALAEVLFSVQVMPGYSYDMDAISSLVFQAFEEIAGHLSATLQGNVNANIAFAGYCTTKLTYRAFKMVMPRGGLPSIQEILLTPLDIEMIGTGRTAALAINPRPSTKKDIASVLQDVIDDPNELTVGGNIQYGTFSKMRFQPAGVSKVGPSGVHYWRGPLDLNGPPFNLGSFISNIPLLDL